MRPTRLSRCMCHFRSMPARLSTGTRLIKPRPLNGTTAFAGASGRNAYRRFFLDALLFFFAPRLALDAFAAGFAGRTAMASISNSAPGRASCEIATVVLAGGADMLKCIAHLAEDRDV